MQQKKKKTNAKFYRFKAKGMDVGDAEGIVVADESNEEEEFGEDEDIDLMRAKQAQREPIFSLANMDDIKSKFESGHSQSREERREERKQEIQNIRSRLFMGKQARIKEMYQQAVADSEQCTFEDSHFIFFFFFGFVLIFLLNVEMTTTRQRTQKNFE